MALCKWTASFFAAMTERSAPKLAESCIEEHQRIEPVVSIVICGGALLSGETGRCGTKLLRSVAEALKLDADVESVIKGENRNRAASRRRTGRCCPVIIPGLPGDLP